MDEINNKIEEVEDELDKAERTLALLELVFGPVKEQ